MGRPPHYPCVNHPDREAFVRLDDGDVDVCRECYLKEADERETRARRNRVPGVLS